ncbi:MAG: sulfatase-like hydrolase/transferase [Verrucomicrobiales bacterium]|nr:sulfatase-like hydrolase/transferase [Verrucomicrobiales bacterium]
MHLLRLLMAIACLAAGSGLAGERPNFLFILVDDQSPMDLKVYNPASTLDTPHLDQLAARGMVIDGAYHMGANMGAVCTPSRHMIMSGRTLWRLPTAPWAEKTSPPALEQQTLPAVFNRAGYATMRTCKMGNSYEAANKLFAVRHDASKRGGDHESGSGWHGDRVMDYLKDRETARDERPFLIYFGFSHPHDTRDGTPELLAKYGAVNHTDESAPPALNAKLPALPAAYLPGHPFDNTELGVRDEVAVSGVWKRRDEASIRNEIGREYACSENIDIQIGRVLERLKAMGELDNTYVIYTADHGMSIGRHGLMGKQNLYQHTWRVPLIVAGPGVKPGSRAEGNVYLLDVLATLCDLAAIEAPETNEGVSFRPVLEGSRETMRDVLYGAYSGGGKPGMRCVKAGDWKLIQYESPATGARTTQLFNLAGNPEEWLSEHHAPGVAALTGYRPSPAQVNLSDDPRYAEKLAEMRALLLSEMRRLEDPYRFSDQPGDDLPEPPKPAARAKKKGKNAGAR